MGQGLVLIPARIRIRLTPLTENNYLKPTKGVTQPLGHSPRDSDRNR